MEKEEKLIRKAKRLYLTIHRQAHPKADGGHMYRQSQKAPLWHHLWRPPDEPAPVRQIMKDGKLCT